MTKSAPISPSRQLKDVRYEIRGRLARRALEMERQGYEILSLNIGNPGLFGFRTPETMRLAIIENLGGSEAYCNQKGIFPAREAVVMQQQDRGIMDMTAEHVFIGNGVSEQECQPKQRGEESDGEDEPPILLRTHGDTERSEIADECGGEEPQDREQRPVADPFHMQTLPGHRDP